MRATFYRRYALSPIVLVAVIAFGDVGFAV